MEWNPIKEIKKLYREFKDESSKAINEIKDGANKAKDEIDNTAEKSIKELKLETGKIDKMAKDAVDDAVKEVFAMAAKGTFTQAVDIAQIFAPDSFGLKIGPIGLNISNIETKIDTLQKWAKNPPTSKRHIKNIIETLAPTSISIDIDVQFAALFVSSESLEVGFNAEWTTENFLKKFDDIIKYF